MFFLFAIASTSIARWEEGEEVKSGPTGRHRRGPLALSCGRVTHGIPTLPGC